MTTGRPTAVWDGYERAVRLAKRAIALELDSNTGFLNEEKRDRAIHYLVAIVWHELERKWDPNVGNTFEQYAFPILRLRFRSWYREELGDSRYGRVVCPSCHGSETVLCLTCEGKGTIARPADLDMDGGQAEQIVDTVDWGQEVIYRASLTG